MRKAVSTKTKWAFLAYFASLGYFSSFSMYVFEWAPWYISLSLCLIFYTRYFAYLHECIHAPQSKAEATVAIMIPNGPLQLGYFELKRLHMQHHAFSEVKPVKDPDNLLINASLAHSFLRCVFQPEIALAEYVKRFDINMKFLLLRLTHFSIFAGICTLGFKAALFYIFATRLSNTITWFIFARLLHDDNFNKLLIKMRIGRFKRIEEILIIIFGSTVISSILYHPMHHENMNIPANNLREISSNHRINNSHLRKPKNILYPLLY